DDGKYLEKEKKIFFRIHPLRKFSLFLLLCAVKAAWKPRLSPPLKNQFLKLVGFQRKLGFRFSPRALADSQKSYKISQISQLFQPSIKTQLLICSQSLKNQVFLVSTEKYRERFREDELLQSAAGSSWCSSSTRVSSKGCLPSTRLPSAGVPSSTGLPTTRVPTARLCSPVCSAAPS
ncbi:unnamed protein product, partial [Prunus brigantina]